MDEFGAKKNFFSSLDYSIGLYNSTNKNQLNNIIGEHLMKFVCCNAKIKYSLQLSNKCNDMDDLNIDKIQFEIDEAIENMKVDKDGDKKELKMSVSEVACDIESKLENRDLERKKNFNNALYGDKLTSTFNEVDMETVIT